MKLTNKYILTFTTAKTQCLVTYYNGQFKRLEYKKGGMSNEFWQHLNKAIPFNEAHISDVEKHFKQRVKFDKILQNSSKSLHNQFMGVYIRFYEKFSNGLKPKITNVEGAALKQIISYLNDVSATEDEALVVWKQVFTYWERLDEFYKNQIQLKQINSNLNTILIQIKDGNSTRKNQQTANNNANDLREKL
ncbi:MAG: hypothetical protein N4A35_05315 [Flavobacteriales bacterium]|jgi:hypothetical protein|nr:hypothetical protein [Flavobacteriales bacterium]